jgi:hypothetical protein
MSCISSISALLNDCFVWIVTGFPAATQREISRKIVASLVPSMLV